MFDRWQHFYNNRRLHGSLDNKTPTYIWKRYEQEQMNNDPLSQDSTKALSTNGERQSFQIKKSRLVDKIVHDQMTTIFENQETQNSQTVSEN